MFSSSKFLVFLSKSNHILIFDRCFSALFRYERESYRLGQRFGASSIQPAHVDESWQAGNRIRRHTYRLILSHLSVIGDRRSSSMS